MYYYAYINSETGLCYDVEIHEEPMEDLGSDYVQVDSYDKSLIYRKKYVNGEWVDTTAEEAVSVATVGEHVSIFNEWLDVVLNNKAPLEHTHEGYASEGHAHTEYVSSDDLQMLEDVVDTKADNDHAHTEYADVNHNHNGYATQTSVDALGEIVDDKADIKHSHTEYALSVHEHDYASSNHNHNTIYSPISHSHNDYVTTVDFTGLEAEVATKAEESHTHNNYSEITHNHDTEYSEISHTHTASEIGAADSGHTHDNRYYTETEIDSLLSAKANSTHNHDSSYDVLGTAETKANEVRANLNVVNEDLTEHIDNADIHFTAAERTKLSGIATNANNYTHPNSGVTVGTYKSVTVNAQGHITGGTNPTTLAGYGITDAETKGAANSALASAKEYADELIADEVTDRDSAIATAKSSAISTAASDATMKADNALTSAQTYTDEAIGVLSEVVSTKANASTLTSHTGSTTVHITDTERANWNAAKTHADSAHAPTTNATQTASGLMSKTDKIKLDGIAEGANNYTLPSAGTSLGGVKSGGDVTISGGVIAVNDDSHNHIISNIDGLQSALDGKAASGHNHDGVYYTETEIDTLLEGKANISHTHTIANITNLQTALDGKAASSHGTHVTYSSTAPVMDGAASVGTATTVARSDHKHPTDTSRAAQTSLDSHTGNKSNPHGVTLAQLGLTATASELNALDGITATVTELNYVDGVTSNIQTQLNSKASSGHTHNYAGSSSAGGAATSANKLNTNAGDVNIPVYFANGVPVACTSLDLDTTGNAATATNVAWGGVTSKPSYYDAKAIKSITRSGTTFTYTCMDGTTGTFTQQDNNTTYSVATTSANGLMSKSDKSKLDGMVLATVSEVETYLGI